MAEEIKEPQGPYYGEEVRSWQVDEYARHERGPVWYAVAFLIALSFVLYAIVTRNFLFALIVIMGGVVIGLSALREPQKIPFQVTTRGVSLGNQFVPFRELRSFWILYEPPQLKNLYFDFRSPLTPHLVVSLEEEDPVALRRTLLEYLGEDPTQEQEPLTEVLGRFLKI